MMDRTVKLTLLGALTLGALASCGTTPIRTPVSDAATPAAGDTPASAPVTAQTIKTRYVDPVHGNDKNDGLQPTRAYRTLARGLKGSSAGDTLKLLPGVIGKLDFPTSGDTFPLTVPNGVIIEGSVSSTGAKLTFLSTKPGADGKADDLALTFAGDATLKNLELDGFDQALEAEKGNLTLSNLNFIGSRIALDAYGTSHVTLTKPSLFMTDASTGIMGEQQAQVSLDGGVFDFSGSCQGPYAALRFQENAHLKVTNTKFNTFTGALMSLAGAATADIADSSLVPSSLNCGVDTMVDVYQNAHLKLTRVNVNGIKNRSTIFAHTEDSSVLEADHLTVNNHTFAVIANGISTVSIKNSTFTGNGTAISGGRAARLDVSGSTLTNNEMGVDAAIVKLRNTSITGGKIGVEASSSFVDLGTSAAPGHNTFRGSSQYSVNFYTDEWNPTLEAVGNTWNADVQGADHAGQYAVKEVKSGTTANGGLNFWIHAIDETPGSLTIHLAN